MSASTLLELTERTKIGLSDNVKSNRIISDVRPSTESLFKTKEKYFFEEASVSLTGSSFLGSSPQFEIKQSEGYVGDFMLECTFTYNTSSIVGACWLANMLQLMTWRGGGNDLLKVSGETNLLMLITANPHLEDRKKLVSLYGGYGGDLVSNYHATTYTWIFPIIAPGSKGILKGLTDDYSNPVWPVGKMNTSLILNIDFKAAASLATTVGSLVLSACKLRYKKYRMIGDIGVPTTSVGKQLVYTTCVPYVQEAEIFQSNSGGATTTDDLKSVITSGELQYIGFYKTHYTNYLTGLNPLAGSELAYVQLLLGGNTVLYQHDSVLEGDLRAYEQFKANGQILYDKFDPTNAPLINLAATTTVSGLTITTGSTGTGSIALFPQPQQSIGRYYNIPISPNYAWDLYNFGSHGVNLNNETVRLTTTSITTGGVPRLKVFAVYKALINLYSDQTAKQKWDFSFNA